MYFTSTSHSRETRHFPGVCSRLLLGGNLSFEPFHVLIRKDYLDVVVSEVTINGCFSTPAIHPVNGDDELVVPNWCGNISLSKWITGFSVTDLKRVSPFFFL